MIKAVLFDLDNTLIDFMTMKEESCKAAIKAMIDSGLPLSEKKAYKILFSLYGFYGIEFQKIFQRFLKKVLGRIDYKILANAITAYRRTQEGFTTPYPLVRPTLLKLKSKGIILGIVTDAPRLRAWLRLAEMNLTEFFDFVITLGDSKQKKPSKMPFNKALRELQTMHKLVPDEILFVGDNPFKDIKGAKSVGMKTALAEYGCLYPSKNIKLKADYNLKNFKDLMKIV